ncbi:uncharacterized protein LOC144904617 [Branchiostoma floridae x Branchiostoma belcheri]
MLRVKHPNLSAIQYKNSIALLHGGAKKITFARLNKQQICMSHDMSLLKQKEFGDLKDEAVLDWKNLVEAQKEAASLLESLRELVVEQERVQVKAGLDVSGNSTISSADLQALDFSFPAYDGTPQESQSDGDFDLLGVRPLTDEPATLEETTADEPTTLEETTDVQTLLASLSGYRKETYRIAQQAIETSTSPDRSPENTIAHAINVVKETPLRTFQIVFDNIDFTVTAHHQTTDNPNRSIHWVHSVGYKDRSLNNLPGDQPQKPLRELEIEDIMPTEEVQQDLRKDYIILVSRVLVQYLASFRVFQDVAVWHIPHEYSTEMEQPTEQAWLGLHFKNENLNHDMSEILHSIQSTYVPADVDEEGNITRIIYPILLGGDQLSEERAKNIQAAFKNLDTPEERLEGMTTKFELWHATVNLFENFSEIFYDPTSSGDKGSLCANLNVIHATTAKKGPHAAFNQFQEAVREDQHAHIIYAAMKLFHLQSVEDPPEAIVPEMVLSGDKHTRRDWLHSRAAEIVDLVFAEDFQIGKGVSLQKVATVLTCRHEGCGRVYVRPKARVTHELKKHNLVVNEAVESSSDTSQEDYVSNYHNAKLGMSLLLTNIQDATKEGDGERIARCFRMALLFYKCYGHTKYAFHTLLFFARVKALLPPSLAHSLLWNRFVNTKGGKGKNIAGDLRLEHMNNLLKSFLKHLGPNLNQKNAARVANSIGEMEKLLRGIDSDLNVHRASGYHIKADKTANVEKLVVQYQQVDVLEHQPGREYRCFPGMSRNPLAKLDVGRMVEWMRARLKHWEALYE